jgi:hypothetical protein
VGAYGGLEIRSGLRVWLDFSLGQHVSDMFTFYSDDKFTRGGVLAPKCI